MSRIRLLALIALICITLLAPSAQARELSPFIDLQEKGLTLVSDGEGLVGWDGSARTLTVNVQGNVRFALLYWAGRQRPCVGVECDDPVQPYRDQRMLFDGNEITGTVVGTEAQVAMAPAESTGNIGYFADVTSVVGAKGVGTHNFTFADNDLMSNLWKLDGVSLVVGYINPQDQTFYRVIIWDGLDFASAADPNPGDNRVTAPVTFNHGSSTVARTAQLFLTVGDAEASKPDSVTISNNPTLFDTLNSSSGAEWDEDLHTIDIPAGVGTTTVQVQAPCVTGNIEDLIWQVAALRVPQPDGNAPTCSIDVSSGPPQVVSFTIQDTGSGLASIIVTKSTNADTVVPPFTVGRTTPLVVTSTRINQNLPVEVELRITDVAGNLTICNYPEDLAKRAKTQRFSLKRPVRDVFAPTPLEVVREAEAYAGLAALPCNPCDADAMPPEITTCPGPQSASANAQCQAAVPDFTSGAAATDDCTAAGSITFRQEPLAGTFVGLGQHTVTVYAKDAAGNETSCTTSFTVTDTTKPTVTCPQNITAVATSVNGAVVNFAAQASDNCSVASVAYSQNPGTVFPVGTTTVTVTATDGAGNQNTCQFTVTVAIPFDRCVRQGSTGDYFRAVINPPAGSESLRGYWEYHRVVGMSDTLVASGTGTVVMNLPTYQVLQQYGMGGMILNANLNTGAGVTQVQVFWQGQSYLLLDYNINDGGCTTQAVAN